MARGVGIVAGAVIFALWFWIIGTRPVFDTLFGVALALGGGYWAYVEARKRLKRDFDRAP